MFGKNRDKMTFKFFLKQFYPYFQNQELFFYEFDF